MLAKTVAPHSLINPLLRRLRPSSAPPLPQVSVPLIPLTKTLYLHSRRTALRNVTAMAENNSIAAGNSPDHVVGEWFSVPDLRLRDHRFSVPLDYSADCRDSPKISIFAREVVSGALLCFDSNQDF
ncbi:hypothetical protein TIFTF001_014276 [Ficus carica]|uniref:Uncharacterized protein n=1 Tax=Ficus carica TaxID=3494 RepID=A0AA88D6U7_FICCA|nr:hypothetical protein TIFTF001_014276 [Ficus carica]